MNNKELNEKVESFIENKPEEAQSILADNSPLMKEAKQVTDGNPNNTEVRKDVVEEATNNGLTDDFTDVNAFYKFLDEDENYRNIKPVEDAGEFLRDDAGVEGFYKSLYGDDYDRISTTNERSVTTVPGEDKAVEQTNNGITTGELNAESPIEPNPMEQPDTQQESVDFDNFIDSLELKRPEVVREAESKLKGLNDIYPNEVVNILQNKLYNNLSTFRKGKYAQEKDPLKQKDLGTILSEDNEDYASKVNKLLENPDELLMNSRSMKLREPETRAYFENKFGHDWVKDQDRGALNRELRNQNIAIAQNAIKYLTKTNDMFSGNAKSNYDLVNDLINGRVDPLKEFSMPSNLTKTGKRINSRILNNRTQAMKALEVLKENNEIRKYLGSKYKDKLDLSEYWNIPKGELLNTIKSQLGINELTEKDNEKEPKLDDSIEIKSLENVEKEYKEDEKKDPLNNGIDWDKVHIYEPGEDPYYKVADQDFDPRIEANNEYEYPEGEGASGVVTEKDEDFAGPDELPALYEKYGDVDNYRQLPALREETEILEILNNPERIYDDPYEHEWKYDIEETREPLEEEYDPNYKFSLNLPHLSNDSERLNGLSSPGSAGSYSQPNQSSHSNTQAPGSRALGNIGSHSGLSGITPMKEDKKEKYRSPIGSTASMAPTYSNQVQKDNPAVTSKPNTIRIPQASTPFGKIGLLGRGGTIGINRTLPASGTFASHTSAPAMNNMVGGSSNKPIDMRQSLIIRLKNDLTKVPAEVKERLGFSKKSYYYRGRSIDEMDGPTLKKLIDLLESNF